MSKSFGRKLWENLDESGRELLVESGARVRYLKETDEVSILMYGDYKFKVPFWVFEFMIRFDKIGGGDEFSAVGLSADVFEDVCLLQFKYRLEPGMLTVIKRQAHLRRLGRVDTAWVTLRERICKGGRRRDESGDEERIKWLRDNYSSIVNNIVKRDSYANFLELEKELHPNTSEKDVREKYKALKKEFYAI